MSFLPSSTPTPFFHRILIFQKKDHLIRIIRRSIRLSFLRQLLSFYRNFCILFFCYWLPCPNSFVLPFSRLVLDPTFLNITRFPLFLFVAYTFSQGILGPQRIYLWKHNPFRIVKSQTIRLGRDIKRLLFWKNRLKCWLRFSSHFRTGSSVSFHRDGKLYPEFTSNSYWLSQINK